MEFLSAETLAVLRSLAAGTLDATCTISRETYAASETESGGDVVTVVVAADEPCWLGIPDTGAEDVAARIAGLAPYPAYTLRLGLAVDVRPGDLVEISGQTYRVEGVQDEGTWRLFTEAKVTEVG